MSKRSEPKGVLKFMEKVLEGKQQETSSASFASVLGKERRSGMSPDPPHAGWSGISLAQPALMKMRKPRSTASSKPSSILSITIDAASPTKKLAAAVEPLEEPEPEPSAALLERMQGAFDAAHTQADGVLQRLRLSLPQPPPPRERMEHSLLLLQLVLDDMTELSNGLRVSNADLLAAAEAMGAQADKVAPLKAKLAAVEKSLAEDREVQDAMEKRIRSNDAQLDLLRNALSRRDWLLAEQRTAFYKELSRFKSFENMQTRNPASDWEDALRRLPGMKQNPIFFDACVFEAIHLTIDDPLTEKAADALKLAAVREGGIKAQMAEEMEKAMRLKEAAERAAYEAQKRAQRDIEEAMAKQHEQIHEIAQEITKEARDESAAHILHAEAAVEAASRREQAAREAEEALVEREKRMKEEMAQQVVAAEEAGRQQSEAELAELKAAVEAAEAALVAARQAAAKERAEAARAANETSARQRKASISRKAAMVRAQGELFHLRSAADAAEAEAVGQRGAAERLQSELDEVKAAAAEAAEAAAAELEEARSSFASRLEEMREEARDAAARSAAAAEEAAAALAAAAAAAAAAEEERAAALEIARARVLEEQREATLELEEARRALERQEAELREEMSRVRVQARREVYAAGARAAAEAALLREAMAADLAATRGEWEEHLAAEMARVEAKARSHIWVKVARCLAALANVRGQKIDLLAEIQRETAADATELRAEQRRFLEEARLLAAEFGRLEAAYHDEMEELRGENDELQEELANTIAAAAKSPRGGARSSSRSGRCSVSPDSAAAAARESLRRSQSMGVRKETAFAPPQASPRTLRPGTSFRSDSSAEAGGTSPKCASCAPPSPRRRRSSCAPSAPTNFAETRARSVSPSSPPPGLPPPRSPSPPAADGVAASQAAAHSGEPKELKGEKEVAPAGLVPVTEATDTRTSVVAPKGAEPADLVPKKPHAPKVRPAERDEKSRDREATARERMELYERVASRRRSPRDGEGLEQVEEGESEHALRLRAPHGVQLPQFPMPDGAAEREHQLREYLRLAAQLIRDSSLSAASEKALASSEHDGVVRVVNDLEDLRTRFSIATHFTRPPYTSRQLAANIAAASLREPAAESQCAAGGLRSARLAMLPAAVPPHAEDNNAVAHDSCDCSGSGHHTINGYATTASAARTTAGPTPGRKCSLRVVAGTTEFDPLKGYRRTDAFEEKQAASPGDGEVAHGRNFETRIVSKGNAAKGSSIKDWVAQEMFGDGQGSWLLVRPSAVTGIVTALQKVHTRRGARAAWRWRLLSDQLTKPELTPEAASSSVLRWAEARGEKRRKGHHKECTQSTEQLEQNMKELLAAVARLRSSWTVAQARHEPQQTQQTDPLQARAIRPASAYGSITDETLHSNLSGLGNITTLRTAGATLSSRPSSSRKRESTPSFGIGPLPNAHSLMPEGEQHTISTAICKPPFHPTSPALASLLPAHRTAPTAPRSTSASPRSIAIASAASKKPLL